MREATFSFRGSVERVGAATMPDVPVGDRTAVVNVEEVLEAPDALADQAGKAVTVELAERPPKPGERYLFFTTEWLYGDGVAVREVGRIEVDVKRPPQEPKRLAEEARMRIRDAELGQRLRTADVVVAGKVASTRSPAQLSPLPVSEHSPQWQEALVDAHSVERGRLPKRRVSVLFARSRDVMWSRAPKLRKGQEAVFLLQRMEVEELRGRPLVVVDPLDVRPLRELPRVRRLIEEGK
jgi:hypothetical protein